MAAQEEPYKHFASGGFVFSSERSFVGAGAEGDFLLRGKGVGGGAVADAGELEAVEQQRDFRRGARADFDTVFRRRREQREDAVQPGAAAFESGAGCEGVGEAAL